MGLIVLKQVLKFKPHHPPKTHLLRAHKLKPNPVHILNPDPLVLLQVLPQAGNKHIQASAQKIIVFAPNLFQNGRTADHLAPVAHQVAQ